MDFLDKYNICAIGAPFPLTEEQQRRYDAPFVQADFELSLTIGKKQPVTGVVLGNWGISKELGVAITHLPTGQRMGSECKRMELAKATVRAIHTYYGKRDIQSFEKEAVFEFVQFVKRQEFFAQEIKTMYLFDKEGRPHNQARYVWTLSPNPSTDSFSLTKRLYVGKHEAEIAFEHEYPSHLLASLVHQLSEDEQRYVARGWTATFETEPILPGGE